MKNSLKKQRGMTGTNIVLMLIGICSVVIMVLRIVPVYMNHGKVVTALEGIKNSTDIQTASKDEVMKRLNERFSMNQVDRKDIAPENIELTKDGDYVKLQITYQSEAPIMGNMSVLMKFDDFIEVGGAPQ